MFARTIETEIDRWGNSKYRKPLILRGARQVGKTTIVQSVAGKYDNYLSINLEKSEARSIFESTDDVKSLLPLLFLYCNIQKQEGRTLLFMDEIQNSPHTVSLLRYFYEELPEIHVIAAGSLLETMIGNHISLPVGRVEYMAVHPCSFVEFLQAIGESRFIKPVCNAELPEVFHNRLNELFKLYSLIGGMPEVIARYASLRDLTSLDNVYNTLLNGYKNDVEKYAKNTTQAAVIRYILDEGWTFSGETITLNQFAGSPYKSRETGDAFRLLEKAMLLEMVYPITNAKMPMISDLKKSPKLFWFDSGLVNYAAKIRKEYVISSDLMDTWRGKAAEQMVMQEVKALSMDVGAKRNYWMRSKRGSIAEVDLVYLFDGNIIPIEVKSGHNAHLKSLHQYMDEAVHDIAVRVWPGKYAINEVKTQSNKMFRLINLPFYMVCALPQILKKLS
jgi:predicted AAA+ superfamily ATPase